MLALIVAAWLGCQDPAPASAPKSPPARPAEAGAPKHVETWNDKQAKAAVDTLVKALKGNPGLAQRTAALEPLAAGSHPALVKPLVQIVETDKSVVVQRRAVTLLANQPVSAANPAIRKLLTHKRVVMAPTVLADVVTSLARTGYTQKQWDEIDHLFEESHDSDRVPVQIAVLELVIAHQEKQALPLLLRNLDEPKPVDVDAADNPPEAYWQARWTAWSAWRDKIKDALFAITGQRFNSAAEAKAWLDKNPLK